MLQDLGMRFYSCFQRAILENVSTYYLRKSASWIRECSCLDFLFNVAKYLRVERETIAANCVRQSRQNEYVESVENQLFYCHPLLRNEKMDDKLYSGLDRGIQLMAKIFRKHVTRHCTSLVKT